MTNFPLPQVHYVQRHDIAFIMFLNINAREYETKYYTHVSQFFFLECLHTKFRQPFTGEAVGVRQGFFHARYVRHGRHFGLDVFFLGLRTGLRTGRRARGRGCLVGDLPRLVLLVFVETQRRDIQFLLFICDNKKEHYMITYL